MIHRAIRFDRKVTTYTNKHKVDTWYEVRCRYIMGGYDRSLLSLSPRPGLRESAALLQYCLGASYTAQESRSHCCTYTFVFRTYSTNMIRSWRVMMKAREIDNDSWSIPTRTAAEAGTRRMPTFL